ncbi:unnamed protein product [Cunninghamella blakesleeana]
MGQTKSKENRLLSQRTHFSRKEINRLRQNVKSTAPNQSSQNSITEDMFKETVKKYVPSVSSNDDVFLKRLYAAFDVDDSKTIDFEKFVDGLSVFMKGTPEEKLELSFKLYDVKHAGYLTRPNLERVMIQLSQAVSEEDQTNEIKAMVGRMFDDLDIDDDGRLTFEEYKLSVMKEPLVVDFLEQFLDEHHLAQYSNIPSRPESVSSYRSSRSITHPHNRSSHPGLGGLPAHPSSSRLSVRVSQAELLEYGHQSMHSLSSGHHSPGSSPGSPTTSTSPKLGNGGSPALTPRSHHLSRPTSMTSLDAALSSMDLNYNNGSSCNNNNNSNNGNGNSTHNNNGHPLQNDDPSKILPINKHAVSPILPNTIKNNEPCTTTS